MWEDNKPALDGFLLYHKLSHYHHGKTPLVGWLCPWMVPEMLGYVVHQQYVKERPSGSGTALEFMNDFDEKRKGQQKRRHFFHPKKKVQQEAASVEGGEPSWTSSSASKMEVIEGTQLTVELDDVDLQEDVYEDEGDGEEEELELDVEREVGVDEVLDETGIELLDKRPPEAGTSERRINGDQKRISTTGGRL